MARYIDADKLEKAFKEEVSKHNAIINNDEYPVFLVDHTLHKIRNYPTADVVEVVRCKGCAYYNAKLMTCYNNDFPFNCESRPIMRETDYCSYGERRTE